MSAPLSDCTDLDPNHLVLATQPRTGPPASGEHAIPIPGKTVGGEEGDGENVETDISINNHTTVSEVKSSEDDEAQKKEISNTGEQRKSEELNETRVEDASVNVEEQPKDSCEQHLDEETKTDKEEQRGKKKNMCPTVCMSMESVCLTQHTKTTPFYINSQEVCTRPLEKG